jgi:hypothetical protein
MRIGTFAVLTGAVLAFSTNTHAELQLVNSGSLSAAEAQNKFQEAWKVCSAELKPGAPEAALAKCVNEKLAKYQLQLVQ